MIRFPAYTWLMLCESNANSGYICVSLPADRLEELEIPMMVPHNQDRNKTAYTVTVDVKDGKLLRSFLARDSSIYHDPAESAVSVADMCIILQVQQQGSQHTIER